MTGADVTTEDRTAAARQAVESNPVWYHTIELAPGVLTPGQIDMREAAQRVLPDDLSGRRALDIGTFDGFWAFEMERRGADVVAIDVDKIETAEWPPLNRPRLEAQAREWDIQLGRGFKIASEALGSSVRRVISNVYDVSAELLGGPVDFAFSGDIMLHLRDPVRALESIHSALAPGGELVMFEPFSVPATLRSPRRPIAEFKPLSTHFNWWYPNVATLSAWPKAAGFAEARRTKLLRPRGTGGMTAWHAAVLARRAG
ncbi:MAG: methyltransferase domain-containing protein [Thermoleophilaceae bacterium]